ncbi:MAG: hypothetical protein AB7Q16_13760 [Vicinamibacterales bacterium]
MKSESTAVDAAIDQAARLLVTPPPDEGLLARVVARLPERPGSGSRLWWVPVASAAALAAWVVLGSTLAPPFTPTQPVALVAEDAWPAPAQLAGGVAAIPPSLAPAAESPRRRMTRSAVEEDTWGLAPVPAPTALVVDGLSSVIDVLETIDVSPLAVEALESPSALSEMEE